MSDGDIGQLEFVVFFVLSSVFVLSDHFFDLPSLGSRGRPTAVLVVSDRWGGSSPPQRHGAEGNTSAHVRVEYISNAACKVGSSVLEEGDA